MVTKPEPATCVVGLGFIGLPTAVLIANEQMPVLGVDIKKEVVDRVNAGSLHFVEPGLESLLQRVIASKMLRASNTPEVAGVYLICVPTPTLPDHRPDLSYLDAAVTSIAPVLRRGAVLVIESSSPVGTTEGIRDRLAELRPDLQMPYRDGPNADIAIAYCPERARPGRLVDEIEHNDRVIGGVTANCSLKVLAFYERFVKGRCFTTNTRTAELCKLAENAYRDVNIAYANELSMICDRFDLDVKELILLANLHPRVNILQPGPGVGGHCIPVDPWFIINSAQNESRLIRSARNVNLSKTKWVIEKIRNHIRQRMQRVPGQTAKEITVAFLGMAFKPDIDDIRESPAIEIALEVAQSHPGEVWAVDPFVTQLPASLKGRVQLKELAFARTKADIVVLLVRHSAFLGVVTESEDFLDFS
jgi:UDP-N-acetyl-D-mannosaminuronic acid dehydrogenase